jgi:DNA-binding CsgD family transcriptional regulator
MLLERHEETKALRAVLDGAREERGGLVVIAGEPGIGKSALLALATAEARSLGMDTLRARGARLEREYAFGLALQLFEPRIARETHRGRLDLLSGAAQGASRLVTRDPASGSLGDDEAFAITHALYWLCSNLADRKPLLLTVDDAHWGDRLSLGLLLYLAERVTELPVALVVATRRGEPEAPQDLLTELSTHHGATFLEPAPLSAASVETIVRQRWSAAGADFVRSCFQSSGGNPFLLRELLNALEAEGAIGADEDSGAARGLALDLVRRRVVPLIEHFPQDARELAHALAVLGGEAELRHVASLADLDLVSASRAADALAAAELVAAGPRVSFRHPLVQAAIYAQIAAGEKGILHRRAAERMADQPEEARAAHLLLAPAAEATWAVDVLRAAARAARAAGGTASAVVYLRRALAEPPSRALRAEVLLELAETEALAGEDGALDHVREALGLIDDPQRCAEAMLSLGWMLHKSGRLLEASLAFEEALREAKALDERLVRLIEVGYVAVAWHDPARAEDALARRSRLLARRSSLTRKEQRPLLAQEVMLQLYAGESQERLVAAAEGLWDEGRLLQDEGPDSFNVLTAIGSLSWADALARAEEMADAALAEVRRSGNVLDAAQLYYSRSWPRYWTGRLADAAADAQAAVDAWSGTWGMYLPTAKMWLALAHLERDDLEAARSALQLADQERWRGTLMYCGIQNAVGRLATAEGRYEEALEILLASGKQVAGTFLFRNPAALPWRSDAAIAAHLIGDRDTALNLTAEEVELARRFGAPRPLGIALRASGIVQGGARGVDLLQEAVNVLERSPSKLELCRALVDLGAALRRAGKRGEARERLRRGLELAERCGAFRLERQARSELTAAGARVQARAMSGRESLTPSELRVAEMAAAGLTNREIAQSLFVTVQAVKWHLRNTYRKLDIDSREALTPKLSAETDPPATAAVSVKG